MLIVNHNDVAKLLPMRECIDVMRDALKQMAKGNVILPLRQVVRLPERKGLLGLMPAYMGTPPSAGIKVLTIFPENHGTKFDAHQGAVLLFEVEHGCLAAVMDATAITAIRTAAVSAVATALLARRDASVLAILGSGGQARTHFEAMRSVRQLSGVRVWSRSAERREAFAESESGKDDVPVEVAASAEAAVRGADIICTVTSSHDVVLRGDWIAAGPTSTRLGRGSPLRGSWTRSPLPSHACSSIGGNRPSPSRATSSSLGPRAPLRTTTSSPRSARYSLERRSDGGRKTR